MSNEPKKPVSLFQWIWHSYLRTALIPLVLVEVVFIGIYFFTNNWSQREMLTALRDEVNTELHEIAHRESTVIHEQLSSVAHAARLYQMQTAAALHTSVMLTPADAARLQYSPDGVYHTVRDTPSGSVALFYSGIVPVQAAERAKAARLLSLQAVMKDIKNSHPLADSLYFNTFDSLNIIYPYFDVINQYAPHMDIPSYNFYYEADAQHNPQRAVKWTDAYLDPAGHGWMTSVIAPVYTDDFLEGVIGIDITINTITKQILDMDIPWHGYGMLIGKDGTILAMPPAAERDWGLGELTDHHYSEAILKDTFKPEQFNLYKRTGLEQLAAQIAQQNSGMTEMDLNGAKNMISWSTVPDTGWKLLILVSQDNVYAKVNTTSSKLFQIGTWMIGGLLVFYCIFFAVLYRKSRQMSLNISLPLVEINNMVQQIGAGHYYQQPPVLAVAELQETAEALVATGQQLGTANSNLLDTQTTLKKKEAALHALVTSVDDVVFEVDSQGTILNVWTNDQDVLAKPITELVDKQLPTLLDAKHAEQFALALAQTLHSGDAQTIEYQLVTPKGLRWFQGRIAIIDHAPPPTISISARDISEQKELEASLIVAKEEAEKASAAKSQFLSSMSHELRTPLNAILGFAQLLDIDTDCPLTKLQNESVQQILHAGNHLLTLINEVLDLAKVESGSFAISREPVQVCAVMEEALMFVQMLAKKNNITIKHTTAECSLLFVAADRTRLKQVLLNLLSNAVKYNRPGGSVEFYCETLPLQVRFHVVDTGYGIPPQELDAIFEPFYRLPVTSSHIEGTGIGLVVAKQLVTLMDGQIGVQSTVGTGSHFWIDLPIITPDAPAAAKDMITPTHEATDTAKTMYHVLYIEDNATNLLLVERILSRHTHIRLSKATTGQQGIAAAQQTLPDIILLDIHLPDMDGWEICRQLRSEPLTAALPIIAVSANAMEQDIAKGLSLGFTDYITKPLQVNHFLEVLFRHLHINTKSE